MNKINFTNITVINKWFIKIFSIAIFILPLNSCMEKVYFDIPQNEKPIFKNNDTVYFTNAINNEIDTFLIKLADEYEISDKRYYHEKITIIYQNLKRPYLFKRFFIQQGADVASISVDGNYFPTIYKNDNTISMSISGFNYQSIYFEHNNNIPDPMPKSVYYSHSHGIIRYDFSDSNYYEIKSN